MRHFIFLEHNHAVVCNQVLVMTRGKGRARRVTTRSARPASSSQDQTKDKSKTNVGKDDKCVVVSSDSVDKTKSDGNGSKNNTVKCATKAKLSMEYGEQHCETINDGLNNLHLTKEKPHSLYYRSSKKLKEVSGNVDDNVEAGMCLQKSTSDGVSITERRKNMKLSRKKVNKNVGSLITKSSLEDENKVETQHDTSDHDAIENITLPNLSLEKKDVSTNNKNKTLSDKPDENIANSVEDLEQFLSKKKGICTIQKDGNISSSPEAFVPLMHISVPFEQMNISSNDDKEQEESGIFFYFKHSEV